MNPTPFANNVWPPTQKLSLPGLQRQLHRATLTRTNSKAKLSNNWDSGCGTSGRVMAFCLGQPGSNPRTDLGFLAVNLFSPSVGLFLITCNRTVPILPSFFLFPIIIHHCKICQLLSNNVPRKRKQYTQKEARKGPYLKNCQTIRP